MSDRSRFDTDPEALAWARGHVEHVRDKMRRFEQQAREKGSDPSTWRKMANLLDMELIGGQGCVVTAFDARNPEILAMLDGGRVVTPSGVDGASRNRTTRRRTAVTTSTSTLWTCDACDTKEAVEPQEQPQGWALLTFSQPPLASPLEGKKDSMHLCRNCALDWRIRLYRAARDEAS